MKRETNDRDSDYILDHEKSCFRTQAALRVISLPQKKWRKFIAGEDDGLADQERIDELLVTILNATLHESTEHFYLSWGQTLTDESEHSVALKILWEQKNTILGDAIRRLGGKVTKPPKNYYGT